MSDLPKAVRINEEGPREGFQIEKGPISTERKIVLIDSLSQTGLKQIQCVSFVNPKNVPGWADAEAVTAGFSKRDGVSYTCLWLNDQGFKRAMGAGRYEMAGRISLTASETFVKRNQNRTLKENYDAQSASIALYKAHGLPVEKASIMAAFGCNFEGDMPSDRLTGVVEQIFEIAAVNDVRIKSLSLADTMAWATPATIKRLVGAVRERWPDIELALHLHDTRGMGIANAYAGLEMGVAAYDAAVAGLGGCPFAAHKSAAGNVCTEDLVFMCEEMGIATGVDLARLVESAALAEDIVGHPLPGSVKGGGTLGRLRTQIRAAKAA
ncbi:MAG: hydroxymethylglutaryl-CoA lyase [Hyphomicrobiaceae bacterium]